MPKYTRITSPPFPQLTHIQLLLSCSHFNNSHQKQLPLSDQERAGCPQKVGLVVYNLCSYHYCTLHWDSWALRNLCAAYNRHCRYSVHLETARKQTILIQDAFIPRSQQQISEEKRRYIIPGTSVDLQMEQVSCFAWKKHRSIWPPSVFAQVSRTAPGGETPSRSHVPSAKGATRT